MRVHNIQNNNNLSCYGKIEGKEVLNEMYDYASNTQLEKFYDTVLRMTSKQDNRVYKLKKINDKYMLYEKIKNQ